MKAWKTITVGGDNTISAYIDSLHRDPFIRISGHALELMQGLAPFEKKKKKLELVAVSIKDMFSDCGTRQQLYKRALQRKLKLVPGEVALHLLTNDPQQAQFAALSIAMEPVWVNNRYDVFYLKPLQLLTRYNDHPPIATRGHHWIFMK